MENSSVPLLLLALIAGQQAPPATEVYVASLAMGATPAASAPVVNISNSPGYDNQPSFLPDGSGVLFASGRNDQPTDIYRYVFATQQLTQLTTTPEAEYSPLVAPDRTSFTVIRVEADKTQRLWRFDLDGTNPRLVLEHVKPVGYHLWIDETRLALFVLGGAGQPNTLQLADTKTGKAEVIDSGIGRSIQLRPGTRTVSYIVKPAGGQWVVKSFDPDTRAITTLVETADKNTSEDTAWLGNWLLMSSGTSVLGWNGSGSWITVGDFASAGIARISRLAVAPAGAGITPRLALVAEPRK